MPGRRGHYARAPDADLLPLRLYADVPLPPFDFQQEPCRFLRWLSDASTDSSSAPLFAVSSLSLFRLFRHHNIYYAFAISFVIFGLFR